MTRLDASLQGCTQDAARLRTVPFAHRPWKVFAALAQNCASGQQIPLKITRAPHNRIMQAALKKVFHNRTKDRSALGQTG